MHINVFQCDCVDFPGSWIIVSLVFAATVGGVWSNTCTSLQVLCVVYILKVNAILVSVLSMSDTLSQAKIQIADFHYHFLILLSNIF